MLQDAEGNLLLVTVVNWIIPLFRVPVIIFLQASFARVTPVTGRNSRTLICVRILVKNDWCQDEGRFVPSISTMTHISMRESPVIVPFVPIEYFKSTEHALPHFSFNFTRSPILNIGGAPQYLQLAISHLQCGRVAKQTAYINLLLTVESRQIGPTIQFVLLGPESILLLDFAKRIENVAFVNRFDRRLSLHPR